METAAAFPLRAPPKLVTRITIVHLIEMIFAGILMVFLVLPAIFKFSLVNASFWQIYGRFYVTGLFGTFFYVALTLPLSVVLGFFMGWARVSRVRIFSWPASLYVNVFRGLPPLILVIFASLFGTNLVPQPIIDRFLSGFRRGDIAVGLAAGGNLSGGIPVGAKGATGSGPGVGPTAMAGDEACHPPADVPSQPPATWK